MPVEIVLGSSRLGVALPLASAVASRVEPFLVAVELLDELRLSSEKDYVRRRLEQWFDPEVCFSVVPDCISKFTGIAVTSSLHVPLESLFECPNSLAYIDLGSKLASDDVHVTHRGPLVVPEY